jgi:transcription elongation factor GreA
MEKILLTRAGYEKLKRELTLLSKVERPQIVKELLETAREGRVEKNPDFQWALAQRQKLERRIRQLQQILANAEVLVGSNLPPNKVRFNSRVRVLNLDSNLEQEFQLVGGVEADAARGQLSISRSFPCPRVLEQPSAPGPWTGTASPGSWRSCCAGASDWSTTPFKSQTRVFMTPGSAP